MKKITNTSKLEVNPDWLMGGSPSSIVAQEKRGQRELSESSQLPTNGLTDEVVKKLESLGIEFKGITSGDDLFTNVKLPSNLRIEPSDHDMWSYLKDVSGKEIGKIFYKAAFYDRRATFHLSTNDK